MAEKAIHDGKVVSDTDDPRLAKPLGAIFTAMVSGGVSQLAALKKTKKIKAMAESAPSHESKAQAILQALELGADVLTQVYEY